VAAAPGPLHRAHDSVPVPKALFPNYHYVKLTLENNRLHGAMYRVANPEAQSLSFEIKDSFDIGVKPR
jgi:hypothetical protein